MSLLSDYGLRHALTQGELRIMPTPDDEQMQPASIDLHLSQRFLSFPAYDEDSTIDPREPQIMWHTDVASGHCLILEPGAFILGSTEEYVEISNNLAGQMDGKSSLGRVGLFVHSTAGWIDPGFKGALTLELFNASGRPIQLWPGMAIGQLIVHRLSSTVLRPYGSPALGSRYHNHGGPVPSMGTQYAREA